MHHTDRTSTACPNCTRKNTQVEAVQRGAWECVVIECPNRKRGCDYKPHATPFGDGTFHKTRGTTQGD